MSSNNISQSMTGRTQSMTGRTTSMTHQPNRIAAAPRSWSAPKRAADPTQRMEAMQRHFDSFPPALGRSTKR